MANDADEDDEFNEDLARTFFERVKLSAQLGRLASDESFSVAGTLSEAWTDLALVSCSSQSIPNWVGLAAIDDGKPLPGEEGLTTAEREELVRLRRQLRQVQTERDILAKATAWIAGRSDATSTKSSDA